MKKDVRSILLVLLPIMFLSFRNNEVLPIKEWSAPTHDRPLIFYLSGDGGFNSFSKSLCEQLNLKGYDVTALNSKSYFWDKKTPEQTALDIGNYLQSKLSGRKNQQIVLIGYSFGADVLPFVLNRLSATVSQKVLVSFIMASSGSTDFEIHWSDIFGSYKKRSMDVVSEINRIVNRKIIIVNGSDENDLDFSRITLRKYTHEVIPGGHHFEGNIPEIVKVIINDMD